MKNSNHKLLTVQETMDLLRLSRPTIIRMIHSGELQGARVGWQWRIYRESVEQMLEPLPFSVPPEPEA